MKVFNIGLLGIVIPFACEDASPAYALEGRPHAADSCKQIYKPELTFSLRD